MILLLGASGYVGKAFQNHLQRQDIPFQTLSLSGCPDPRQKLADALRSLKPAFLINSAGYTGKPNVDAAEHEKAACLAANTELPRMLAEVCDAHRIPWGHVSSGCIYTGSRPDGSGFTEDDPPNFDFRHNNCSFYSGTKALAEELLKDAPQCYLWRLRIPFNEHESPRNYLTKIMSYPRLLDVRNSISRLDDFVAVCCATWTRRLPFGTYNVTNPGSVTTREITELLESHGMGRPGGFQFFASEEEFMRQAAATPRSSCVLDSSKLARHGIVLPEVREAITWCLKNWRSS